MFFISDESLEICLSSSCDTVGKAFKIAFSKYKNKSIDINECDESAKLFALLLVNQNSKYLEKKKELSEIRRNNRKKS